jgi:AcrR family transcriptional regulator
LTRRQILDASLSLFSERGFARTTVRDIARVAGITDAAIYYHFASKQELLEALVEERGFVHRLQELKHVSAELPIGETLMWMARGAIHTMDDNREFLRLIIIEGLGGDEAALEQYRRLVDLWESGLSSILERYSKKGEVASDDVRSASREIIYVILMAFQDSIMGERGPEDLDTVARRECLTSFADSAIDRLLRGLHIGSS